MKAKIDTEFWNKLNLVSKGLLIVGMYLTDLAFRLSGMAQEE